MQVVVAVDLIQEQDARLGKVIGRLHDGVPQLARRHFAEDPQPVAALVSALVNQLFARLGRVHQFPLGIVLHGLHEGIAHAHRDVEVVPAPGRALGGDELEHIGVVDAQHAHLRATARARAFNGRAALVKHVDVAARAAGDGMRALDFSALGADAAKVVTHTAAPTHGFGRLAQCLVNTRVAFAIHALNGIAHRLHEAVDEGSLNVGAACAHDAPRANGPCAQIGKKFLLPLGSQLGLFGAGQRAGNALVKLLDIGLARLQIFFAQHIAADGLHVRSGCRGRGGGIFGGVFHEA